MDDAWFHTLTSTAPATREKPQHRPAFLRAMKVLPPTALSFRFQDVGTTSYSFFVDLVQTSTRMKCLEIVLVVPATATSSDFQWLVRQYLYV